MPNLQKVTERRATNYQLTTNYRTQRNPLNNRKYPNETTRKKPCSTFTYELQQEQDSLE